MFENVFANPLVIRCVNTNRYASCKNCSIKGHTPLRRVESDDIDCFEFFYIKIYESFGET